MKNLFILGLIIFCSERTCRAEAIKINTAKTLSKFMKPAIDAKDAPATCWFLGKVEGYALALRNLGDSRGIKLFELVKDGAGKCGGKNSLNLNETFTPEEWTRLSELQKKIEAFSL